MTIYVTVVCKGEGFNIGRSNRPEGDWASFCNNNKQKAIEAANTARNRWQSKGYGPYRLFVGRLTHEATVPVQFELEEIK